MAFTIGSALLGACNAKDPVINYRYLQQARACAVKIWYWHTGVWSTGVALIIRFEARLRHVFASCETLIVLVTQ